MAKTSQTQDVNQDPSEELNTVESADIEATEAVETEGTENEEQTDSSSSDEMNEEEIITNASQVAEENAERDTKRNLAAEAGKMSKLEKERNAFENETKALLRQLDKVFSNDRDAFERFRQARIEEGKGDIGSYESVYSTSARSTNQEVGGNMQENAPSGINSQDAAQIAQDTYRAIQVENEGFQEFIKVVPELDPANLKTDEERDGADSLYQQAKSVALNIMRQNGSIGYGKALISAFNALHPDREASVVKTAVEAGKLIGQANANANGVGVSGVSSGSTINEDSETLGELDKEVMKKLGISRDKGLTEAFMKHKKGE